MEENYLSKRTNYSQRLVLFFCSFILCLVITLFVNALLLGIIGVNNPAMLRISVVLQDVIAFILPVLITSVIITTNPIKFLMIQQSPKWKYIVLLFVIMFVSIPAMNWLVEWNKNISLPESMSGIETWMRNAEDDANEITKLLLNNTSVYGLVVSVLIVGVLTGFSEEFFFRGMFQRILSTKPINIHVSIWVVAFFFSLFHFQFFGFFPRLLLGAFFGYLLWWSGSLWIPVIAHALNNSMVVISSYLYKGDTGAFETIGVVKDGFPTLAVLSFGVTACVIFVFLWFRKKDSNKLKV